MGVPKFFRYMSERYPSLSQLVREFEIPEFDNLYLDMNGIIHVCSHPNDFDPHFRISEDDIFKAIFHYIEFLFKTIKPQKLFFLAVDGVAPRAKMNQQRGRRFRSAKEAEVLEAEARKKGHKLPEQARFDSNCITPGTVFMDRLHHQLQYFISHKISSDPLWHDCKVILSGHETPGEGEHKIMDYIRYLKTLPDYDPNLRHCLYGLDADLIMLGLCTHDPNFCLLREEVRYDKKAKSRITTPEQTKFYLLYLGLMREYLDYEFQELKTSLNFPYNLENIIDDWVLMGFLIGNDFIPHLPELHINKGALDVLHNAYKEVMPKSDGYLNENGYLNLRRFQAYLKKVADFDKKQFEERNADLKYFEEKTSRKIMDIRDENNEISSTNGFKSDVQQMIDEVDDAYDDDDDKSEDQDLLLHEFYQHKSNYYRNKLEYHQVTDEVLKAQAEGYIRAIQWNLHYYYHGCRSWSWFYPHHYSPFVSDVANFSMMDLNFDMGKPFLPFHQLLAVLPPASKSLLPEAYQQLMTAEDSPILDFYPPDFDTDLNGKLQEWEAVVLIPFIQEDRLLEAMEMCKDLTDDEMRRNSHGPMQVFTYSKKSLGSCKFLSTPEIKDNHAIVNSIWPHEIAIDLKNVKFGLQPGFKFDVYVPGFSTLRFIPHTAQLKENSAKVSNYASKGHRMILTVTKETATEAEKVAPEILGEVVYVGWPHLIEAKVVSVEDHKTRFTLDKKNSVVRTEMQTRDIDHWKHLVHTLQETEKETHGIKLGEIQVTVNAHRAQGHRISINNDGTVKGEKIWKGQEEPFSLNTMLTSLKVLPLTRAMPQTLEEAFPVGSKAILLAQPNYGAMAEVLDIGEVAKEGIKVLVTIFDDLVVDTQQLLSQSNDYYMPSHAACRRLGINHGVFVRITGSIYLQKPGRSGNVNLGLNLKHTKKNLEIPGYTRRDGINWLYSQKTVELVGRYWEAFPEIFDFINATNTNDFKLEDVYGRGKCDGKEEEIVQWLKTQPHHGISPITCGADMLSMDSVIKLEAILQNFVPQTRTAELKVKPTHLFKSDLVSGNVAPANIKHELTNRVVCCRTSYAVPLGLRGFIIGIQNVANPAETTYDILFDTPFQGGLNLNGSSSKRAYQMPATAFINITTEQKTHPLLRQGAAQTSGILLRPDAPRAWGQQTLQRPQPSAFAFVNQSQVRPYPVMPSPRQPNSLFQSGPGVRTIDPEDQQKFAQIWHELKNPKYANQQVKTNEQSQQIFIKAAQPPQPLFRPHQSQQPVCSTSQQQQKLVWTDQSRQKSVNRTEQPLDSFFKGYPPQQQILKTDHSNQQISKTEQQSYSRNDKARNQSAKVPKEAVKSEEQPAQPKAKQSHNFVNQTQALMQALNINKPNRSAESSTKSHISELLSHFERSPLGMPKYKVHPQGNGVIAQVTLPTGAVYWGVSCETKEAALENAALQALAGLGLTSMNKARVNEEFQKVVKLVQHPQTYPQQQQQQPPPTTGSSKSYGHSPQHGSKQTQMFYNSQIYRNKPLPQQSKKYGFHAQNIPSLMGAVANLPTPDGGLPMPPSNWRQNVQTKEEAPNSLKSPPNYHQSTSARIPFIPLQAITGHKATPGLRVTDKPPITTVVAPLVQPSKHNPSASNKPLPSSQDNPANEVKKPKRKKRNRIAANLKWSE